MDGSLSTVWADLVGRLTGPMTFRLILQPLMSTSYAIRDGLRDAREHRPPYFWTIFAHRDRRRHLLREGWRAVLRVILLGVVMDVVYQLIVLGAIHMLQVAIVVFVLAFLPYLLLRGLVNRLARRWLDTGTAASAP